MATEIQRYKMLCFTGTYGARNVVMSKHENGDYVLYADYEAKVRALEELLELYREQHTKIQGCVKDDHCRVCGHCDSRCALCQSADALLNPSSKKGEREP